MKLKICVYTLYGRGKPYLCGILNCSNGKKQFMPLYLPGTGLTIGEIEKNKRRIAKFFRFRLADESTIVISDYKLFIEGMDIPFYDERFNVYDLLLPEIETPLEEEQARGVIDRILTGMSKAKVKDWHRVAADAAVAYASIEERGLLVYDRHVYPRWSQHTFSGRTKTTGYNIQGAIDEDIRNPAGRHDDYLLHFDWRAADIRMAALLTKDERLMDACEYSDPYQYVADVLNEGTGDLSRDICKIGLLKAINSLNAEAEILAPFPVLRAWVADCRDKIRAGEPLYSLLGRKFTQGKDRKALSVINATMQGSIAHAMQICVRRVWEELGLGLMAEIHDSVVVSCHHDNSVVKSTIKKVVDIMCHPFSDILDSDPVFPVRVSVGTSWRKWKELRVYP